MNVFDKLNLKNQSEILVINAPQSFEPELATLKTVAVRRKAQDVKEVAFSLAFVVTQREVDATAKAVGRKAKGDAVVWFAYPKGTSKKYKCEFNRDTGWKAVGAEGFEPVRMVAIDEDWSAVRFRRVKFIQRMTRDKNRTLSKQGKAKAAKKQ